MLKGKNISGVEGVSVAGGVEATNEHRHAVKLNLRIPEILLSPVTPYLSGWQIQSKIHLNISYFCRFLQRR